MVSQRVVMVWLVFLAALFAFTLTYFVLTPAQGMITAELTNIAEMFGISGEGEATFNFIATMMNYGWIWIAIISALLLLAWAVRATTKKEGESYYGRRRR